MKRRKHTPEQIVRKLREADRLLGEGHPSMRTGTLRPSHGPRAGTFRTAAPIIDPRGAYKRRERAISSSPAARERGSNSMIEYSLLTSSILAATPLGLAVCNDIRPLPPKT